MKSSACRAGLLLKAFVSPQTISSRMRKTCLLFLPLLLHAAFVWCQNPVACTTNQAPGANSCAEACLHCFLDGRTGQTGGYSANPAPGFCGTVENNQWFGFVAASTDITITASPSNCQSGDGIEIALYENCSDAPIACAVGQSGEGSALRVLNANLTPGQTYFLMIDGFNGDFCSFQISVTPANAVMPPPAGSPGAIQGPTIVVPGGKIRYSIAPVPGATAYRWTAPAGTLINGQSSPVVLPATSGNQVVVTFGNQEGTLCVTPEDLCSIGSSCLDFSFVHENLPPPCGANNVPASDICEDACVLCNFNGYTGNTFGYTGQTPPGFCQGVQNEQWIAFVAGATTATFTCTPSNCANGNGIQLALYASCSADGPLACAPGQVGGGQTPLSVSSSSLEPGVTYYLVIDGFGGDWCDFQLSVSPPTAAIAIPVAPPGPISGPGQVCPSGSFNFSVEPVSGAGAYYWSGPPGCTVNGMPSPVTLNGPGGNVAQVRFGTQSGPVCVQAVNSCYIGTEVCKTVTVKTIPVTNLPPVTVCAEDAPYYTPWGHECPNPGTYCTTLTTASGCDSMVCIQVNILAPIHFVHAPKVLCAGDSVVLCGEAFYTVGNHQKICESYRGCDSTVHQVIVAVLNSKAEILPDQDPLCAQSPLVLSAAATTGSKTWSTLAGQPLGTENSITVTDPGTYILTVQASAGQTTCSKSDTVTVAFGAPVIAATGGTLTCYLPSIQLDATTNPPGLALTWSGPDGFSSDQEDPVVSQPGQYVLTATDPGTGCTAQATVQVAADFAVPTIAMPALSLNCTAPEIALNCPVMPSVAECLWSGPGIATPVPDPVIAQAGVYLLTITNLNNGCTATSELTVTADFQVPVITAYADPITCLNTTITIHCETDMPMAVCDWSGDGPDYLVTATAPNGCSATATVTVVVDAAAPTISVSDGTLHCNEPSVTLIATTNTPNALFSWSGPGGFSSSEQNPTVNQAGQYVVTVTNPVNGCSSTATATVLIDAELPLVLVSPPDILTCTQTAVVLQTIWNIPAPIFFWSGPGGFSSTQANPEVEEPGLYTLTTTNPATGCSSITTVEVQRDVQIPDAEAAADSILTCTNLTVQLMVVSAVPADPSFQWTGPGIVMPGVNPVVNKPGTYTLVVTDLDNGCTNTDQVEVLQDVQAPVVTLVQVEPDQLGQGLGAISISVMHTGSYTVAWYHNGQVISNMENIGGLKAGEYTVVVTGSNGCTDTITVSVLDTGVSAPELADDSRWVIFPNPADNWLYVRYEGGDLPEVQVLLLDATGRLVLKQHAVSTTEMLLSCEGLPSGVYSIVILTREGALRQMVLIQK